MHETNVSREEVLRRMMSLAAGKANDPVKLAYLPEEDRDRIARLDLGCLTEFKRNASGTVEMKFVDRTAIFVKVLDQLKEESNDGPAAFLHGPVGEVWGHLVPGKGVLLRRPGGKTPADRPGVRPAAPGTGGVPEGLGRMQTIIESILPCHVWVEYALAAMTWAALESQFQDWDSLEGDKITWTDLEDMVV